MLLVAGFARAADALPVLQIAFSGDAAHLASGADSPFTDLTADALRLERPALLTDVAKPLVHLEGSTEEIISVTGQQAYSGTEGYDAAGRVTVAYPVTVSGHPATVAASGEFEDGLLRLQNRSQGLIAQLQEERFAGGFAAAVGVTRFLRAGATIGAGRGVLYAFEATGTWGPLEVGVERRAESLAYSLSSPEGSVGRLQRPPLTADLQDTRELMLVTARLRQEWVDTFASFDFLHHDYTVDAAVSPFRWITLRGHADSVHYAFGTATESRGVSIGQVDLGAVIARWAVGADLRWGRQQFVIRRSETDLSVSGAWRDNGAVTGQELLALPVDLQLSLQEIFGARLSQSSIGWSWAGEHWSFGVGAQYMDIHLDAGGIHYGSAVDVALDGHNLWAPAEIQAAAATGGVGYAAGPLVVHLSAAQLVPLSGLSSQGSAPKTTPEMGTPPPSGGGGGAPAGPKGGVDGGRMVSFDITHTF